MSAENPDATLSVRIIWSSHHIEKKPVVIGPNTRIYGITTELLITRKLVNSETDLEGNYMKYKDPASNREISEPTDYLVAPEPRPSIWEEEQTDETSNYR